MKTPYLALLSITFGLFTSCVQKTDDAEPITDGATQIPVGLAIEGEPNMIISPYKPYNKIDVKGYKSGETVGDPSTIVADPKTGKADKSTIKPFLIP